ncbi:MAG: hypothetical protein NZ740_08045 [Kiritimatiellae bacterium]|nr:hypothetical protein [Kiritimatiellia bacterium]MDW8459045.1 hypothetical protein [Verrucomicrobiota bacterium]
MTACSHLLMLDSIGGAAIFPTHLSTRGADGLPQINEEFSEESSESCPAPGRSLCEMAKGFKLYEGFIDGTFVKARGLAMATRREKWEKA